MHFGYWRGWQRLETGANGLDDHCRARNGEGSSSMTWRNLKDRLELVSQAFLRCPALSAVAGLPCQSPTAAPSRLRRICHRRCFGGNARHAPHAEVLEWMWKKCTRSKERAMLGGFSRKSEKERCWFVARGIY